MNNEQQQAVDKVLGNLSGFTSRETIEIVLEVCEVKIISLQQINEAWR